MGIRYMVSKCTKVIERSLASANAASEVESRLMSVKKLNMPEVVFES